MTIAMPGGPDVLEVKDRSVREAGEGEVRVAVKAAAVNPADISLREAGAEGLAPPWVPGMDLAGLVESVGDGVDRVAVGDAVMAAVTPRRPEGGAQAALVVVPAASVVRIPDGASFEDSATLPMNGLTAMLGLSVLGLSAGEALGVSGGAGLLGSFTIAIAKTRGLRVIADAAPADESLVRGFGADEVLPRGTAFPQAVRDVVPEGVAGFFDTALLGGDAFPAIRDGGGMVALRGWDGSRSERGIHVHPIRVSSVIGRTDWLWELREFVSAGRISLRVAATFPPERVGEAQRMMNAGGIRGRAVIVF